MDTTTFTTHMFIDNQTCPGFTVQLLNEEFILQKQQGVGRVGQDRRQEIIDLVTTSFCNDGEPLARALNIPCEKFRKYTATYVVDKAIKEELSLVCTTTSSSIDVDVDVDVDDDNNDANRHSNIIIVGVMLNEDFYDTMKPMDLSMRKWCEKNYSEEVPLIDLLLHIDKKLVEKKFSATSTNNSSLCSPSTTSTLTPNMVLHASMGCTRKEYSGKGLATKLRALTVQYAKLCNYSYVCVEPTHPATKQIWTNKLGGKVEYTINAKEWVHHFQSSSDDDGLIRNQRPFSESDDVNLETVSIVVLKIV